MNLREVRTKIKSFNNIKKITKAMQMVSSVKMKRAQKAALEGRPFREALERMIERVSTGGDMKQSKFVTPPKSSSHKDLVIFITANKGLSGSFLTSLNRYVLKQVNYDTSDFISVGRKGAMFLGVTKGKMIADFSTMHPISEVSAIFSILSEEFLKGTYKKVHIVYNKFINTIKFETTNEQILPVQLHEFEKKKEDKEHQSLKGSYEIEPSSVELIDALLKSYVEEKIRGAILNSEAAEHSSRMIAMKNATENASDLIYNLVLEGNKLRQQTITNELLDMITAKESVES
jgi:F-type H+-transporting ATPase subunit gamma